MNVKVEKLEGNKAKLSFVVEKEKFAEAIDRVYNENSKHFSVPGFRKGKVPKNIVMKTYGEQTFYNDAFEKIANEVYPEAIKENDLKVIARPEIDIKVISINADLEFDAVVELEPEIKIGKYKGIELKKIDYTVTDEDIINRLNEMADTNARIVSVSDKTLEKDNISIINFEGFLDGVPFEGGKGENYELTIGSGSFIPGFEDQLIGMKVGEEKDINVTFPEEYHSEELKGKPAVFKVKLNEIKEKQLPNIDDEFAKDVSEFDNLNDLKNDIKTKMEKDNVEKAKHETEDLAIDAVVANTQIEIPRAMINTEVDYKIEELKRSMQYQGLNFEQYLQIMGQKEDDVRVSLEERAEKDVKIRMVLEAIIEAEKIEVTDEDLENKFVELAKSYNKDIEEYKKGITPSMQNYYKENLKYEKAIKCIIDNAKIK